jgi:hypothetical protein
MALTRIKTNQITDLAVTAAKIANNTITAGKLANNLTYGSDFTVSGNLTVSGTTTSVSTTNTRVEDAIIALSSEATGSASVDSGLLINRGDDDNYALIWDESADQFVAANVGAEDGDTAGNVTISSYANFQAGTITYATLNDGTTALTATAAELNLIDGSSAGTIVNSKAVIYGSSGEVNATTLQIGGTSITATAAELNIMDGDTSATATTVASGDRVVFNDAGTMVQVDVDDIDTYFISTTQTLSNKTINSDSNTLTLDLSEGTLTGTTAEFNSALSDDSFATLTNTVTLTNKTIDSASNTLTLDLSEGTLTGTTAEFNTALSDGSFATLAGTETITNKTITAPIIDEINDANGNELIIFTTTTSAVNEITLANAAASGAPTITTTGSDTNINLVLSPKGSGTIDVDTSKIVNVTDPTANQDAATKAYVDAQVSSGSTLTIAADSGSDDTVTVGSDTLTFAGTANEITTAVTNNQIQIGLPDDVTIGGDATITGNLTVNGTTTTLSTTNSVVSDSLIELNNGAGSNANDLGFIMERGSTGDNAAFIWDESADVFVFGTTTATGASTGDLTVTKGGIESATINTTGTATLNDATVGGGYGSTGVTISAAGVIQANGAITSDGAVTGGSLTDGTLTASSGALTGVTTITTSSTAALNDATVGGGYGSTGVTISAAGVIQANGAITSDGAITGGSLTDGTATLSSGSITGGVAATFSGAGTFGSLVVGGGYGDTGVSISAAGVLQANGAITSDGAVTGGSLTDGTATLSSGALSGATTGAFSSNVTVGGNIDISGGSGTITTNVGDTHVLYSVSGVITGEAGFTYNATSNELTIPSATISDLTSGRVVLAGTSGAIEDSGNLTFDGSTLAVTGSITTSSNVDIADAGSLRVGTGNDFTINHDGTNTAITNGTGLLTIDGTATSAIRVNEAGANVDFVVEGDTNTALLTVDASQDNVGIGGAPNANAILDINDTGAILIARGTTGERPTTAVTGMFRYNTSTNGIEYYSNTAWTGISSDFTLATSQTFSGDNSTVAFTLSALSGADSYTVAGVLVMLNGVVQEPTTVYGISGTTLTFTSAPASGDLIEVRKFTTTSTVIAMTDADGDTQIQVEETADEDVIRFDIAGSEKMVLNATQLSVTGNIVATGDITANGDITLGDADTDSITLNADVASSIIPDADDTYDLGTSSKRWRDLYLSGSSLHLGDLVLKDNGSNTLGIFQSDGTTAATISTDNVETSFTLAADIGTNDTFNTGETLTLAGGTGIDSTVSNNQVSFAIDSTVATLTGSQTLTNKTLTSPTINSGTVGTAITLNAQADLRFADSDSSNWVAFQAPATVASNVTWTLPNADAAVSGYALVSDSSGTLSWAAAGATTTSDTTTNAEEQLYFGDITSGAVTAVHHDADLTYNPSTGSLSSDVFIGALTGNVTGDVTGNADTATALETARTIAGNSFDGTANITIASTDLSDTADLARLAGPAFTGTATGVNLTLSGNLTVNGDTTTLSTTNSVISDNLIELNNGAGSNANDSGIVIERGSTGDNAFMGWDESADKFVFGTTTATGASTGDLTISSGTVVASTFEGALSGNATTASAWQTARTLSLTGAVTGSASVDGSGNVSLTTTATSDPTITLAGDLSGSATLTNLGNATLTATLTKDPVITLTGAVTGSATMTNLGNVSITTTATSDPTITLTGDVTGSGTMTNLGNVSFATTIAANSVALGTDTTGNYVGAGATSGSGISGSVSSEGGTFTVTSNATSSNTGSTIVFRDGSGNFSAGVITGTSTTARYADLAEMYAADAEIEPGTVVHFAGEGKLAACDTENCRTVAGIVSTDPAYLMNSEQEGVALALAGRVPCKVTGVVNAGDLMVSAGNGMAMANNNAALGTVIGKAIEANAGGEGVIEVLALMM